MFRGEQETTALFTPRHHTRHWLFFYRRMRGAAPNLVDKWDTLPVRLTSTTARNSSHRAFDAGLSSTFLKEGHNRQ